MVKFSRSKKGGWGLPTAFSIIGMMIFTLIMLFLFRIPGCTVTPEAKILAKNLMETRTNYDLGAFLMTPMIYEGAEITVADMITLAINDPQIRSNTLASGEFLKLAYSPDAWDALYADYESKLTGKTLSLKASEFMKIYADYAFSYKGSKNVCRATLEAGNGTQYYVLYDARYPWYKPSNTACNKKLVLSQIAIPNTGGDPIYVIMQYYYSPSNSRSLSEDEEFVASQLSIFPK